MNKSYPLTRHFIPTLGGEDASLGDCIEHFTTQFAVEVYKLQRTKDFALYAGNRKILCLFALPVANKRHVTARRDVSLCRRPGGDPMPACWHTRAH